MIKTKPIRLPVGILLSMSCALLPLACVDDVAPDDDVDALEDPQAGPAAGSEFEPAGMPEVPVGAEGLPVVQSLDTFVQRLPQETALGENVALHVKLPPPRTKELEGSRVRVIGTVDQPLVLVDSQALVELGLLDESPGEGFFTAFLRLDDEELERRATVEAKLAEGVEKASDLHLVFRGRTPVALASGVEFAFDDFEAGKPVALGPCPIMPFSELARWEESLMITDTQVVQDGARTWDSCLGAGDPEGVWTFHHLMREMAAGASMTAEEFTVEWLETWLNDQVVNGDTIPARMNMFTRVIEPWATASGATASMVVDDLGHVDVKIDGELNWKLAPFRLSAIVNRIDLGKDSKGGGGYGGGVVSSPQTAGELRFVFGVQDLQTCNVMRFSVIFEYGVPLEGCKAVREWAIAWTNLNSPSLVRFSDPWRDQLEKLTETVVTVGAAPGKGNDNAINQVRTNENALNKQWEFREFTLTKEDPTTTPNDTPASGPLRPHSVAMTVDDTAFSEFSDPFVDGFTSAVVLPSVGTPLSLPADCSSSYEVPLEHVGVPLRGGNSFTAPVNHWQVTTNPASNAELCARHEFSLNNCNGCHFDDTATPFFHVDPIPMPAGLSDFLTGGLTGVHVVTDPQFPGVVDWTFADLDRRFNRLYEVACAECGDKAKLDGKLVDAIVETVGVVPIDPSGPVELPIGAIVELEHIAAILELRKQFASGEVDQVEVGTLVREGQTFVH
jgi:hypothetical protein